MPLNDQLALFSSASKVIIYGGRFWRHMSLTKEELPLSILFNRLESKQWKSLHFFSNYGLAVCRVF